MRKLLQFVTIVALLLSGDALSLALMPCCAQQPVMRASAEMQMQSTANCHEMEAPASTSSTMDVQAATMLRCPRGITNLQAADEWKRTETADLHASPYMGVLQVVSSAAYPAGSDRTGRSPHASQARQPDSRTSLPLRI